MPVKVYHCKGTTLFVERIVLDSGESVCLGSGWRSIPTRCIHNIDGLILSALKYILSCYVLKWFLKTNYEIPWPSLLSYKWYLVCNQIGF